MPADPDPLQQLVLADRETAPLPEQELLGLERRDQPVADHVIDQKLSIRRGVLGPTRQILRQSLLFQYAALTDELVKLLDGHGNGHEPTATSSAGPLEHPWPISDR